MFGCTHHRVADLLVDGDNRKTSKVNKVTLEQRPNVFFIIFEDVFTKRQKSLEWRIGKYERIP